MSKRATGMIGKPTPESWRQGVTLLTRQTRTWSTELIKENDERERRCIFSNFHDADEGRSRILVARFERVDDAQFASAAPDLYRELAHLVRLMEPLEQEGDLDIPGLATLNGARAALAKALPQPPHRREGEI